MNTSIIRNIVSVVFQWMFKKLGTLDFNLLSLSFRVTMLYVVHRILSGFHPISYFVELKISVSNVFFFFSFPDFRLTASIKRQEGVSLCENCCETIVSLCVPRLVVLLSSMPYRYLLLPYQSNPVTDCLPDPERIVFFVEPNLKICPKLNHRKVC